MIDNSAVEKVALEENGIFYVLCDFHNDENWVNHMQKDIKDPSVRSKAVQYCMRLRACTDRKQYRRVELKTMQV